MQRHDGRGSGFGWKFAASLFGKRCSRMTGNPLGFRSPGPLMRMRVICNLIVREFCQRAEIFGKHFPNHSRSNTKPYGQRHYGLNRRNARCGWCNAEAHRVPALQRPSRAFRRQPTQAADRCAATVTIVNVAQGPLSSVARRMSKEGKTELLPIDSFFFVQAKRTEEMTVEPAGCRQTISEPALTNSHLATVLQDCAVR